MTVVKAVPSSTKYYLAVGVRDPVQGEVREQNWPGKTGESLETGGDWMDGWM